MCIADRETIIRNFQRIEQMNLPEDTKTRIKTIKVAEYIWQSNFRPAQDENNLITAWATIGYGELANLPSWEANSLKNPNFIINKINWNRISVCPARELIIRF
jgi:ABC-type Fe3+/spermidine/putrescine transport system ATPase subunit